MVKKDKIPVEIRSPHSPSRNNFEDYNPFQWKIRIPKGYKTSKFASKIYNRGNYPRTFLSEINDYLLNTNRKGNQLFEEKKDIYCIILTMNQLTILYKDGLRSNLTIFYSIFFKRQQQKDGCII
jgi:hypothetical protein